MQHKLQRYTQAKSLIISNHLQLVDLCGRADVLGDFNVDVVAAAKIDTDSPSDLFGSKEVMYSCGICPQYSNQESLLDDG